MATARGRESADLGEQLQDEPYRFNFFQAVRLLERLMRERARHDPHALRQPVGGDVAPQTEVVRFRALPALSFPPAAVTQLRTTEGNNRPAEMLVAFLGLTGPMGVLPEHYTALLLRRLRDKDTSLRDLLDLFHHRLVSLFYRAWEKYRLPAAYERSRLDPSGQDADQVTPALYSLVGLGTAGLRGHQEVADEVFLYYSGHFAHHPRSAGALELMLGDHFRLPVRVHPFEGRWLLLGPDDQSRLPEGEERRGQHDQLGFDVVIGDRIWDVQGKFRLRLGPLTYEQFRRFFPAGGQSLRPFCELTRSYVGMQFVFDLQLVLLPDEVPWPQLTMDDDGGPYLGWDTWVRSEPFTQEVEDAVLFVDNL
jgi:type VI secretion system protein ImpH